MADDKGFQIHDRRKVKDETALAEERKGDEAGSRASRTGGALPPVDFSGFVLGLGQMALVALGEVPDPGTGRVEADLEQARHSIDLLDLLEAKTRGNLTQDEETLLRTLESELKLKYVRATHRAAG